MYGFAGFAFFHSCTRHHCLVLTWLCDCFRKKKRLSKKNFPILLRKITVNCSRLKPNWLKSVLPWLSRNDWCTRNAWKWTRIRKSPRKLSRLWFWARKGPDQSFRFQWSPDRAARMKWKAIHRGISVFTLLYVTTVNYAGDRAIAPSCGGEKQWTK